MTTEGMKSFIAERIESIQQKEVNAELFSESGILLHFIPETLFDMNPIDWGNKDHVFKIKYSFRRFSELDTIYTNSGTKIIGYSPNKEYFSCFQNGVIEVFKGPVERQNSLNRKMDYVCVDDIFYAVKDFIKASKEIHKQIYTANGHYNIFITLIGVAGTYFVSFDKNYITTQPFPGSEVKFEPFILHNLDDKIIQEIISGVHYGITSSMLWSRL